MTDEGPEGIAADADEGTTGGASGRGGDDEVADLDTTAEVGGRTQLTDSGADALEGEEASGDGGSGPTTASDPLRGRGGPPTEEGVTEGGGR